MTPGWFARWNGQIDVVGKVYLTGIFPPGVAATMKSLRPWIPLGLLLAISAGNSLGLANSDDPAANLPEATRPAAVSPDVGTRPDDTTQSAEKPEEHLTPEPDPELPAQPASRASELSESPKPKTAIDLDSQFEAPAIVTQPVAPRNKAVLELFSAPTTTRVSSGDDRTAIPKPPVEKPAPPVVISEPVDPLLQLINDAVEVTGRRYLTADLHTPWQIIHGLLAYRQDFVLKTKDGGKVNALEWASSGVTFQGESLFLKTPYGGQAHPYKQMYWFEGHPTQFMAYMTMCRLPGTHGFKTAAGEVVTVSDIINNAKMEVNRSEEMTWTLWALAHYLEPDATWTNKKGEEWSLEELVRLENTSTVYDAPCGGTHGLFALSYARNSYLQSRKPLRGVWLEADQKIQRFIAEGQALQNSDGSFSIHFFKGPGYSQDFNTRITSSGHMTEWLMVALPQSRLSEPWIQNGLRCLASDLINNRHLNAECGPLYHAVDGLQIYRERMRMAARLAQRPSNSADKTWKPMPAPSASPPKPEVPGAKVQVSTPATTDVPSQSLLPQTRIRIAPGVEVVVPRRGSANSPFSNRPIQSAEQPANGVRR